MSSEERQAFERKWKRRWILFGLTALFLLVCLMVFYAVAPPP